MIWQDIIFRVGDYSINLCEKNNAICELKHKELKKSTHTFMSQEGDRHYNQNLKLYGGISSVRLYSLLIKWNSHTDNATNTCNSDVLFAMRMLFNQLYHFLFTAVAKPGIHQQSIRIDGSWVL